METQVQVQDVKLAAFREYLEGMSAYESGMEFFAAVAKGGQFCAGYEAAWKASSDCETMGYLASAELEEAPGCDDRLPLFF